MQFLGITLNQREIPLLCDSAFIRVTRQTGKMKASVEDAERSMNA